MPYASGLQNPYHPGIMRSTRRSALRSLLPLVAFMIARLCSAATLEDIRPLQGTTWYTVTMMGQRVGYASSHIELLSDDTGTVNGLRIVDTLEAKLELAQGQEPLTLSQEIVTRFGPDLKPVAILSTSDEFGRQRVVEATVEGEMIHAISRAGGTETVRDIPLTPEFGSELLLPLDIASGILHEGESREVDVFNPELMGLDRMTAIFTGTTTMEDGEQAWQINITSRSLPVQTETYFSTDGAMIRSYTPSLLQLTLQRVSEEEALEAAAPLVLSSRLSANVYIADPRQLIRVYARLSSSLEPVAELVPQTSRQTVVAEGDNALVTILRLKDSGVTLQRPITGEEFADCFRPSEMAQINHPLIQQKATEIVGDETDARIAASKIVLWVYQNLRKVESEPRLISAREVLEQMSGDCTEHSILCATLCNAAGIPTRMLAGIAYARGGFYYHAWNEIYVGEWVEMDATWGELEVDAGHIRLASATLEPRSLAQLGLMAGRSLGALSVEILEHELDPETALPVPDSDLPNEDEE